MQEKGTITKKEAKHHQVQEERSILRGTAKPTQVQEERTTTEDEATVLEQ